MRSLNKAEIDLITFLLDNAGRPDLVKKLPTLMVQKMDDGEMGSLKFLTNPDSSMWKQLSEATLLDADGVPVSLTVNIDTEGKLYELDVFKTDFSKLIRFPEPPYLIIPLNVI